MADVIRLSFPARADLLILARLTAAAVAARAELGVDEIEDLRLAVDELCVSVMGKGEREGELTVEMTRTSGSVEISCSYAPAPGEATVLGEPPELSSRILEALVDAHSFKVEDGGRQAWLKKVSTSLRSA